MFSLLFIVKLSTCVFFILSTKMKEVPPAKKRKMKAEILKVSWIVVGYPIKYFWKNSCKSKIFQNEKNQSAVEFDVLEVESDEDEEKAVVVTQEVRNRNYPPFSFRTVMWITVRWGGRGHDIEEHKNDIAHFEQLWGLRFTSADPVLILRKRAYFVEQKKETSTPKVKSPPRKKSKPLKVTTVKDKNLQFNASIMTSSEVMDFHRIAIWMRRKFENPSELTSETSICRSVVLRLNHKASERWTAWQVFMS